jgi:hypothetical protein
MLDEPLSVTGTKLLPTLISPSATSAGPNIGDLDDLCTNIEIANIFDYDATKSIYHNNSPSTTPPLGSSARTSTTTASFPIAPGAVKTTACTTYNPLVNFRSASTPLEKVSEEPPESEDFAQKVNQLSEAFSRAPEG